MWLQLSRDVYISINLFSNGKQFSLLHQQRRVRAAFCAQVHLLPLIVSRERVSELLLLTCTERPVSNILGHK